MASEDGGPAFPQTCADALEVGMVHTGMSLRDWFAGQALARLADFPANERAPDQHAERVATQAYRLADAMLKARANA